MLQRTIALAVALGMLCVAPGLRSQEKEKGAAKPNEAKLAPDRMGPLEKGTWHYEIESLIDPSEHEAVFKIRVRYPVNQWFFIDLEGALVFRRVTEAEARGQTELSEEFLLLVDLRPGRGEQDKLGLILDKRILFMNKRTKESITHRRVQIPAPAGATLKNIMKIKDGSGVLKTAEPFVIRDIDADAEWWRTRLYLSPKSQDPPAFMKRRTPRSKLAGRPPLNSARPRESLAGLGGKDSYLGNGPRR